MKRILAAAGFAIAAAAAAGAGGGSQYVGTARCRDCHPAQFEAWKGSAHARSTEALSEKERQAAKCRLCHTTGDGRFDEVGCEACHGAGRYYAYSHVMKDRELAGLLGLSKPGEKDCGVCHSKDSPNLRPFDARRAMETVRHWGGKESAREKDDRKK